MPIFGNLGFDGQFKTAFCPSPSEVAKILGPLAYCVFHPLRDQIAEKCHDIQERRLAACVRTNENMEWPHGLFNVAQTTEIQGFN